MIKVTISAVTDKGVFPNFYQKFKHECLADEYAAEWRKMASKQGVLIRVDREEVNS